MRIFLSIKYHSDHRNREHIEAISNALRQQGHETVCVVRDVEQWGQVELSPAELMARTFQETDACDLLLVDLAEKGIGVGIEAGYAYVRHVPIVTIAPRGSDISTTLGGISRQVVWYSDYDELAHHALLAPSRTEGVRPAS